MPHRSPKDANSPQDLPTMVGSRVSSDPGKYEDPRYCVVLCSCPDQVVASNLAKLLIESKLAACVNVLPEVTSFYTWKKQFESSQEVLMLIKTRYSAFSELSKTIQKHHPYDCPEIVALPIELGNLGYLQWLNESLS